MPEYKTKKMKSTSTKSNKKTISYVEPGVKKGMKSSSKHDKKRTALSGKNY